MLSFSQYYMLKESPDLTYTPDGLACRTSDPDARAFGYIQIHPDIPPTCLAASEKMYLSTHYDLYKKLCQHLHATANNIHTNTYSQQLISSPDISTFTQQLLSIPKIFSDSKHNKLYKRLENIHADVNNTYSASHPLIAELNTKYRTQLFKHSGRLWLDRHVISFYNLINTVPKQIIHTVLSLYNISPDTADTWYIDVINPDKIDLESTPHKILPTVAEYFSTTHSHHTPDPQTSQKITDLISKQHTITHPTLKKYIASQHSIPKPNIPLDVKHLSTTSESIQQN